MKKTKKSLPWGISPAGKILSADCLLLLQNVIDNAIGRLEKQHWTILPYFPPTGTKHSDGALEILKNLALWSSRLEMAKSQICKLFEAQYENEKPLGNISSVRKERKVSKKATPPRVG